MKTIRVMLIFATILLRSLGWAQTNGAQCFNLFENAGSICATDLMGERSFTYSNLKDGLLFREISREEAGRMLFTSQAHGRVALALKELGIYQTIAYQRRSCKLIPNDNICKQDWKDVAMQSPDLRFLKGEMP
jgi:hypothetical protein